MFQKNLIQKLPAYFRVGINGKYLNFREYSQNYY